jgi:TetR/AcrR family transcriptional regulator
MDSVERILASALAEFARHGLEGARVERIASRARINKAMIYYHFRSKEELYRTVVDRQFGKIKNLAEETMSEATSPESTLLKLSRLYHSMFEDKDNFVPMFLREVASGGGRLKAALTDLVSEKKSVTKKAKRFVDNGKRKGWFRDVDSKHAVISFMGMNLGYLIAASFINLIWDIKNEKKFRRERPEKIVDLFLNGIKAR